jgi:hypothetical protein
MVETTDQIKKDIARKREDLRSNLRELEGKVKSVTDWREYVRRNPATTLAVAFGVGLLAAHAVGRGRRSQGGRATRAARAPAVPASMPRPTGEGKREVLRNWGNIQSALIGAAASKVKDVISELWPGFREHLRERRDGDAVQGEGNYEAARHYRRSVERFVRNADIEQAARQAAPRDEHEAAELEAAEAQGRSRAHQPGEPARNTPRQS